MLISNYIDLLLKEKAQLAYMYQHLSCISFYVQIPIRRGNGHQQSYCNRSVNRFLNTNPAIIHLSMGFNTWVHPYSISSSLLIECSRNWKEKRQKMSPTWTMDIPVCDQESDQYWHATKPIPISSLATLALSVTHS